jgi:hypothetical protein
MGAFPFPETSPHLSRQTNNQPILAGAIACNSATPAPRIYTLEGMIISEGEGSLSPLCFSFDYCMIRRNFEPKYEILYLSR